MGKKDFIIQKKLAVLSVVKEKKHVLFGNFKKTTNAAKQNAWEEVLAVAKSLELVSSERNWTYVRDNLYGLWKSRTLVIIANYTTILKST